MDQKKKKKDTTLQLWAIYHTTTTTTVFPFQPVSSVIVLIVSVTGASIARVVDENSVMNSRAESLVLGELGELTNQPTSHQSRLLLSAFIDAAAPENPLPF